jgi:serine/threonine protein kinase
VLVDSNDTPRLVDFGLTSVLYNTAAEATTRTGYAGGTIPWMSPELHRGQPHSFQSDVYALAITLWEVKSFVLEAKSERLMQTPLAFHA